MDPATELALSNLVDLLAFMPIVLTLGAIIGWVVATIVVVIVADRIGRNGFGAFAVSLALSPIIGFLYLIALGPNRQKLSERGELV